MLYYLVQNGHDIKVGSPKYSKCAAAAAEVQEPGSRTTETLFREQFRFCGVNIRILSEFYQNFIQLVVFCHRSPGCRVVLPLPLPRTQLIHGQRSSRRNQ